MKDVYKVNYASLVRRKSLYKIILIKHFQKSKMYFYILLTLQIENFQTFHRKTLSTPQQDVKHSNDYQKIY